MRGFGIGKKHIYSGIILYISHYKYKKCRLKISRSISKYTQYFFVIKKLQRQSPGLDCFQINNVLYKVMEIQIQYIEILIQPRASFLYTYLFFQDKYSLNGEKIITNKIVKIMVDSHLSF